jgi:hypothetical protein
MRTPEQDDLAAAVRGLLSKQADSAAVRAAIASDTGYDADLWAKLCGQIGVAELDIAESAIVLEELGYSLAPTPLLASVIAAEALRGTEGTDVRDRVAGGEIATLVTADRPTLYGAQATILLALTGAGLVLVESAEAEDLPAMDQTLRLASVRFDGTPTRVISDDGEAAAARARAAALIGVSALALGCARRGLDMTVAYSKERVQFGRQIGSFQALKHRMADMLVLVEMARSAAWSAAAGSLDPDIAAAYCIEAAQKVAAETIQLHGGIAITWEHDAHLVFKRAHALGQLVAQPHELRAGLTLSP